MRCRHPVPIFWLMTDERMGEGMWQAVERLPRGAGIVFRHHATPAGERKRLFARLLRIARRRGLVLVRAGTLPMAGEMGVHGTRGHGLVTWPVHDWREARTARRVGAAVTFVSPVFGTRSHPGAASLGVHQGARLARTLPMARVALGGMNPRRFRRLSGFDGWAAIDAWLG